MRDIPREVTDESGTLRPGRAGGLTRRGLLQGRGQRSAVWRPSAGWAWVWRARPAMAQDDLRAAILQIPGVGKGPPTDADWQKVGEMCLGADQGQRAGRRVQGRRAVLHGPQQPEPPQRAVPRLPEAWADYTGAKINWIDLAQADYNAAPAAVDRHRHGRLRHHRDGRSLRGRRLRQGPALRDAGLGQDADRHGRLCRLPQGAGRHLGWQDLSHLHRRRLPQLQLPHRLLRRRRPRRGLEGRRRRRLGVPTTWQQVQAVDQVPEGQEDR